MDNLFPAWDFVLIIGRYGGMGKRGVGEVWKPGNRERETNSFAVMKLWMGLFRARRPISVGRRNQLLSCHQVMLVTPMNK
jgi:hypothetical protein